MGHLVHPLAFRFGNFVDWPDSWFIRRSYYADFLHNMLKMRAFLTYYAYSSFLERAGFFVSHFCIVLLTKFFLIRLFIHNGDLENIIFSFTSITCFLKWSRLKVFNKKRFFLHHTLKIFVVLLGFSNMVDIDWDLKFFIHFLLKLRNFSLLNFLKYDVFPISSDLKYFFLFLIYIMHRVFCTDLALRRYPLSSLIKRLIFSYSNMTSFLVLFTILKLFLKNV